ncbi:hypothetical protein, conserved [Trypanosoma brucei gambiense DAL972]|uniref:RING-type domain-containing protein n=1 Tax=Trypanosoma brucei gambiense (strain MHOM/CI/86/DAL972) TaxID=679716 RepID=C9ZZA3_TRYB9|nr:hypothetical protein, conserved [Trypanosoma brucei gambiense DAL972]CBH14752.1 hypothetical protein, conserved [Trypanosoma brucei gambiense DAL972]|eukprot:XP_011777018.1 hypothetical protein, conserved [Trypanosoma brucei gambiense DAL972]
MQSDCCCQSHHFLVRVTSVACISQNGVGTQLSLLSSSSVYRFDIGIVSRYSQRKKPIRDNIRVAMPPAGGDLPSIGPKVGALWGDRRTGKRREQVHLWSAVALQEHFARGAKVNCPLPTLEEAPPQLPGGRLTLAQKMGLVPLPPQPPSEDEWSRIEGTVLRRMRTLPLGSNVCCICQEPFYATMEQGQVLLNCHHVYHENCLRQFERFTRQLRGKYDATPLSCPMCRNPHYHKRVFYAGKAMEQRAAIVKIQAFFRRVLARKIYLKMRVESDSKFCGEYATKRLARVSEVCAMYATLREKCRTRLLDNIGARLQRLQLEGMTRAQWDALRERTEKSSPDGVDCPICLGRVPPNPNRVLDEPAPTAEDIVASFRKEYEARRAKEKASMELPKGYPNIRLVFGGGGEEGGPPQKPPARKSEPKRCRAQQPSRRVTASEPHKGKQKADKKSPTAHTTEPSVVNNTSCVTADPAGQQRYGVLLSCGHCFHDTCLSTFERYTEMTAVSGDSDTLLPTCPVCRSAYVKVDY